MKTLLDNRIHEQAVVPVSALIFSEHMLEYCKANVCGNYNKSWTCPPGCGSIKDQKEKIRSYKDALVFTTKHNIEDSFDYEGMNLGRDRHAALTLEIRDLLLKEDDVLVYGAGACPICTNGSQKCAYPESCRFPEKQIGSIEAAGIDVAELSKTAGISYNNGPNTVTFFSLVLLH